MGLLACLFAAIFSSSKDLYSKKISLSVVGIHSAFASFVFALPFYCFAIGISWLFGYESFVLGTSFWWLVLARSLTDAVAEWSKMQSMVGADISQIVCFLSLAPLFLLVSSPLITGDVPGVLGCCGVVLTVVGSLIALDGFSSLRQGARPKSIALALLSSLFFSLNSSFDRLAVQQASPLLSGAAMTFLAAVLLVIPAIRVRGLQQSLTTHSKDYFIRGLFELFFMVLKLTALQYMQAPYVAGLMKMSLILSIIGGKVLFDEPHFKRRIIAGIVIAMSISLILIEEYHLFLLG